MVCTFTGHRPERLPWGSDERDARCAALRTLIQRAVTQACADGFDAFLCGMARGCDMYFAEAVLAARETFPQIRLTAMIPCPTQPDAWPQAERARYARLLAACDAVCVLEPVYSDGCMLRRNRAMVDAAETRKAAFTIFPRSSIFSIIVIAGTGLTMPIRRPAALLSFMPVFLPIKYYLYSPQP